MDCDIAIVGGGLVGLAAALSFAHQGRRVKLFEARAVTESTEEPLAMDVRSIALSYSTQQIFRSLGLWEDLEPHCAPIKHIHVSSAGHFGVTRMHAEDLNLPAMGHVIEYHTLISVLHLAADDHPSIELISPAKVQSIDQHGEGLNLHCDINNRQQILTAAMLVVADGAASMLAQTLNIETTTTDYQQTAIVANVKMQQAETGYAYERFTTQGPMAMLPLTNQRYAMVWTQSPESANRSMDLPDSAFIEKIYAQFGMRLGYFEQLGRRDQFPLKMRRANQLVSGRCVLIGNAANTLHPVAGQGFNLGMRDIANLFDLLLDNDLLDLKPMLESYQYQRIQDHEKTVSLGNGLVHLFSNDLPVLNHLRAAALAMMDICPTLKNEMSWQGMGYGAGASSLMRGADMNSAEQQGESA